MKKIIISCLTFFALSQANAQLLSKSAITTNTATKNDIQLGANISNPNTATSVPMGLNNGGWKSISWNAFWDNSVTGWKQHAYNLGSAMIQHELDKDGLAFTVIPRNVSPNTISWGTPKLFISPKGVGINSILSNSLDTKLQVVGNSLFDGKIRIGNFTTQAEFNRASDYLLAVKGKVMCEELKIQLFTVWPDYVFQPHYSLRSLASVESYINEHKHLPGVPSAQEISAQEGINASEMIKIQMEKIEELTLYIIELNKQVQELKAQASK